MGGKERGGRTEGREGGGMDGWREEMHYSGFIVAGVTFFSTFFYPFLFPAEGHSVDKAGKEGRLRLK